MLTQSHKLVVELLTLDDLKWFVETAAVNMLMEELKRPELINLKALYALAERGLAQGTAFIVKRGYEPVGALGAMLVPNIYNPDIITFAELFWYVLPEYRNTRAGALLFSAYDKKGAELADEASMSILPSSSVNIKTLEKRGYVLNEFSFRKEYKD